MSGIRRAALVSFVGAVAAAMPTAAWAEAPAINHDAVGCIVVDKFPRLEARFDPAENVSRGRLRFRPTGGAHWYSVPMTKELEAFVGVLPKPTAKLKSLDYYVEVTATDFATGRTQEYVPEVVSGIGACQGDKITAGSLGSATIILEVPAGAPAVPAGFSSVGIVSATAAAGAMAAGAAAGGAGGISTTALVVGGVAVAGGAAAAVIATRQAETQPLVTGNLAGASQSFSETLNIPDIPCTYRYDLSSCQLRMTLTDTGGQASFDCPGGPIVLVAGDPSPEFCGLVDENGNPDNTAGPQTLTFAQLSVAGASVTGTSRSAGSQILTLQATRDSSGVRGAVTWVDGDPSDPFQWGGAMQSFTANKQ